MEPIRGVARYPFYRAHAHLTSKRREPWIFGSAVLEKVRSAVLMRYRLLPMWHHGRQPKGQQATPRGG